MGSRARWFVSLLILTFMVVGVWYVFSLLRKDRIREERNVEVPMRDGVNLFTDIYRPDEKGRFPVILVRTPYKKEKFESIAHSYTKRGYVVAVQDCRGCFASVGIWEPYINEPEDGYDTIEWLAGQPWSTGKVGMIGESYLGSAQWWAARERPPHLVTIIPNCSLPDPFYNIPYEYGVLAMLESMGWLNGLETDVELGGDIRPLPVIDLYKPVVGRDDPIWRKWLEHPVNDEYWEQANFLDHLEDVRIPVFHQSGWFDADGIGTKLNYLRMASHGHPYQKLIMGPWGHTPYASRRVGDLDFGPKAAIDLPQEYMRWFDYWLKGIDNGIVNEPLVRIFAMGSNKWLEGNAYPLERTRFQKWYLSSGGAANTSTGDGLLLTEVPAADSPPDRYTYDPGDPTPAPCFFELPGADEGNHEKITPLTQYVGKSLENLELRQAYHDKIARSRRDILVYTSEPLTRPLTFAGPIEGVLYASSSGRDTDWFMRLMEVDKKGKIFELVEGKIRARYRRSTKKAVFLNPGEVYKYDIDMWQTGITVPVGHRLRVEVASASFPVFSRNLNTGGHNEKDTDYVPAEQTIYHNTKYPSHVLLPVIPDADEPKPRPSANGE
ncbi:MAG: CocE/NonD family hydrolase [Planctomycetes bacterium]|nr:CocE/NonD family hydrolase [Planctomycetota bacterium]